MPSPSVSFEEIDYGVGGGGVWLTKAEKPQQTCKPLEAVEAVVEDGRMDDEWMDDGGMNG